MRDLFLHRLALHLSLKVMLEIQAGSEAVTVMAVLLPELEVVLPALVHFLRPAGTEVAESREMS